MKGEFFLEQIRFEAPLFNVNCHVHEVNRAAALGELPAKASVVDCCLEGFPEQCIDRRIVVVQPDAESIVDEAAEVLKHAALEPGKDLFHFVESYEEIGYR